MFPRRIEIAHELADLQIFLLVRQFMFSSKIECRLVSLVGLRQPLLEIPPFCFEGTELLLLRLLVLRLDGLYVSPESILLLLRPAGQVAEGILYWI